MKEFIEKLIERLEGINHTDYGSIGSYEAHVAVRDCLRDVKNIVNQLAEEYKGGWISCSERLPEENQEVRLTYKNSAGLHTGEAIYKNKMFFYVTDTQFGYYEEVYKHPVAWKPKDEPYQPKGE